MQKEKVVLKQPLIFQTMNYVGSNNLSLKYQRFTTLGVKDIGIRKSEFVTKNQLLCCLDCSNYLACSVLVTFKYGHTKQKTVLLWKMVKFKHCTLTKYKANSVAVFIACI